MLQHLIQPSFGYTSPVLVPGQYNLCVECGSNYLTILIFGADKTLISLETYMLKEGVDVYTLEYILNTEKYKKELFSDVVMVSNSTSISLVPQQFYKSHISNTIHESIHGDQEDAVVCYDEVSQWELVNVYAVDKFIYDFLKSVFPQTRVFHLVSLSLISIFKNNLEDLDAFVKLYFTPNYLTIILIKGAQLQYAQAVYYETTEDAIYHILNVFDKYAIDLTDIKALASGYIDEDAATWKELRKYILDIDLEKTTDLVTEDAENSQVASHFFTPHLQVLQCV